jgi:hypothetical protein
MDPMNDLDREVTAALLVEPSRDFAARVRARIASEPTPARWGIPRLALAVAGVALAALAANLMLVRPESVRPADAAVLPHGTVAVIEPLRAAPPSMASRIASPSATRTQPEVFVSKSEMLALRRLFSGEIVAPPAGDVPDQVVIPPIAVDAITLPAIPEGERR